MFCTIKLCCPINRLFSPPQYVDDNKEQPDYQKLLGTPACVVLSLIKFWKSSLFKVSPFFFFFALQLILLSLNIVKSSYLGTHSRRTNANCTCFTKKVCFVKTFEGQQGVNVQERLKGQSRSKNKKREKQFFLQRCRSKRMLYRRLSNNQTINDTVNLYERWSIRRKHKSSTSKRVIRQHQKTRSN